MDERTEIRLSGHGGQGIILASVILAEAIGIYDGKNVAQTQSYGPESRGGASKAEVVVSDGIIDHPKANDPDILMVLNETSYLKFAPKLKSGAIMIVDSSAVHCDIDERAFQVPIADLAINEVGRAIVTNIVALGVLAEISGIVSRKSLRRAVVARVPKITEAINRRALRVGFMAGAKALKKHNKMKV